MTEIQVAPITGHHTLDCPHCSNPFLKITSDQAEVPHGGYSFQDGDMIPGLRDLLTEEQRNPDGFDYELLVGTCPSCQNDYYAFEARFVNAPLAGIEHIMIQMARVGPERNFVCEAPQPPEGFPRQWVLVEDVTPSGPMHSHLFGPFALTDDDEMFGPNGVSSCCGGGTQKPWAHARDVIRHWWDDMRILNRAGTLA